MTYTFSRAFVLVQFFMLGIGLLGCRGFAQISRLSDAIPDPQRGRPVCGGFLRHP